MVRDIVIVIILSTVLVALTFSELWLVRYVCTGMASIHVAVWYAVFFLVCTAIGGALIKRVWLGISALVILWTISIILDAAAASKSSFADVAISSLIPATILLSVFIGAWWMAGKVTGDR